MRRVALFAAALVLVSLLVGAPAALGACSTTGQTVTCTFSGQVDTVVVPPGVQSAQVEVRGGHGSQDNHNIGPAGPPGLVNGVLAVKPGDVLKVYVADSGYETRWGFAHGGGHGIAPGGPVTGFSGGRGGGASAIVKEGSSTPLIVAGGGGGGGGDGAFPHWPGGRGGAGAGGDGPGGRGGSNGTSPVPPPGTQINGLGGDAEGPDGENGVDANALDLFEGAGGGGGGGYPNGGGGGGVYVASNANNWLRSYGGGGAGGGDSYADPSVQNPTFRVADVDCPEGGGGNVPDCQGLVTITWQATPAIVKVYSGANQGAVVGYPFADVLQAQVLADDGLPAIGATVTFRLPDDGPGATFDGGFDLRTATAVTNELGVATAPPMTANGVEGHWSATATVEDLPPAAFPEANLPAATRTIVYAPSDAVAGRPLTLTALVMGGREDLGVPTGRIQFWVDDAPLGDPVPLDVAGVASSPPTTLTAGPHKLQATYVPEPPYEGSVGEATEVVKRAPSIVTLESSANPSDPGEEITFTATVDLVPPASGTPTGLVRFRVDGSSLGPPVELSGGQAQITTDALTTGTHEIVATYDGDDEVGAASATLAQSVGAAATGVSVVSSERPSVFGTPPTFTARMTSVAGPPTGAVDFSLADGTVLCAGVEATPDGPDSVAECTPAPDALHPGLRTVRAEYSPDSSDFAESFGVLLQPVDPASTTVDVEAQPSSAIFGQSLSLHADVTGAGDPTGSVRFLMDGAAVGQPVPLGVDGATLGWPPPGGTIPAGGHVIEARYGGDPDHAPSRAFTTTAVTPALTTTTLTASANPSRSGDAVSWTANVAIAGPGPAGPSGSVRFRVDGQPLGGAVPLVGGVARSPEVSGLKPGMHEVRATFTNAAGNLSPSRAALFQQVLPGPAPPPPRPPTPPSPPAPPRCQAPLLALTQLSPRGRHVVVKGIALPHYAYRRATVLGDDQRVGRATVGVDGRFSTRVERPRGRLWHRVRYRVKVGRVSTPEAPLRRPLHVVGRRDGPREARVTLVVRRRSRGRLVLQRLRGCRAPRWQRVERLRREPNGRITVRLARPAAGARPRLYRVRVPGRPRFVSLPIVVAPRG